MNISEDFIPENDEFKETNVPSPPFFINDLPEPTDFVDDSEEMEELPPIKSLQNTPSVTDFSQFLAGNVADAQSNVANDLQSVADVEPNVANDLQSVADVEPNVANDLQSVADAQLNVANDLQSVADAELIVAKKEENAKEVKKIDGEVASAVISCYPSSLQAIKEYYLTTSFVSQRELTAYICKNFIRVFEVDNYIADLNKTTLERNQLKQQLEAGIFDKDKVLLALQKSVVDYQNQVLQLTKERDELKSSLGQLVERNIANNQVKEATSSDTWQEERKTLIAQFTAEYKQGFQKCQAESFETCKSFFDYAINHTIDLMYVDTWKLHRGTGFFKTSAIREKADFYMMFKMYIQQYYDHAEKIKVTETLQNSDQ